MVLTKGDAMSYDDWKTRTPEDEAARHRPLRYDSGLSKGYRACRFHGWALHTTWAGEGGAVTTCDECKANAQRVTQRAGTERQEGERESQARVQQELKR